MTERRGDQGFAVVPQRIGGDPDGRGAGGGPARRRRLATLLVLGAGIAVVGVAWAGPRLDQRPEFNLGYLATPVPRTTPSPSPTARPIGPSSSPRPTPLPPITRPDGVTLEGHVAMVADRFRVLDLATGTTAEGPEIVRGRDAVFPSAEGSGWTCVCFLDDGHEPNSLGLAVLRIDSDGSGWRSIDLGTEFSMGDVRFGPGRSSEVDLAADRRHGLIATSEQVDRAGGWTFAVRSIDVTVGRVGSAHDLGNLRVPLLPQPSARAGSSAEPELPPDENAYLDGPNVRMAPDGRSAFVWATAQRSRADGVSTTDQRGWRVTLDDAGAIVSVDESTAFEDLTPFCWSVGFVADDRLLWICRTYGLDPVSPDVETLSIRILDADGRVTRAADLPSTGSYEGSPLLDRANGLVYFWSPSSLLLTRIDLATMDVEMARFDEAGAPTAGIATGGGQPPDWHELDSIMARWSDPQMIGEAGSSRLFLVGAAPSPVGQSPFQRSLGIFVADGAALALLDRWAPAANYLTLSYPSPGLVMAVGVANVDADGRPAPWLGTLTVHDSTTGSILGRYAQFAEDVHPWVVDSGGP